MERNFCKISVIIPVYHTDYKLFERCLESIQQQDETDLEVVIVFDEPAMAYQTVLNRYREKGLKIRVEEQNHSGVASARNKGIRKAQGE